MSPEQFKQWRTSLKLTQVAASEVLGVSRVTIQNWENAVSRIPAAIEFACEIHQRRWTMRSEFGPVTLTYFDAPLWQPTFGPVSVPNVTRELYPDNSSAIARARELLGEPGIHNLLILAESGDIVWNSLQLQQEREKPRTNRRKTTRTKLKA